jgi:sugar lactone lactonase YvrE
MWYGLTQHFQYRAGFSFITMAVTLTILALVFVSVLPGRDAGDANKKVITGIKRLDRVEEAMRGFMAANGRRPCPADGSAAVGSAGFGQESITGGVCNITAGMLGPDTTGNLVEGVIPTRALWLSDDYAFDDSGHRYTYLVDKRATVAGSDASACNTVQGYPANTGTGGIQIKKKDTTGTVVKTDNVMVAYISSGSGFGAFPMQGSIVAKRINNGSTDADMLTNAAVDSSFTYAGGGTGTFTNTLVMKAPTSTFDQVIWYRTDLKNICCLGAVCSGGGGGGGGGNPANNGIWVADSGNNRIQEFNTSGSFLLAIGTSGTGNGQFASPSGIAIDAGGNVWVADTNNMRIQEFNSSGSYLSQFGSYGAGNGQFAFPEGIFIDSGGNLWIADNANQRVQEFNSSGSFLSKFGSSGTGNGQFGSSSPWDQAIDSGGNIWVPDSQNNRIEKFNSSGSYLSSFGSGTVIVPTGIAFDSGGYIWIADTGTERIDKFNTSGSFLMGIGAGYNGVAGSIGTNGTGNGQFYRPYDLAIDSGGNIWVADTDNNRVQEFNNSGSFLMGLGAGYNGVAGAIAASGSGNGQFKTPFSIATFAVPQNIWVVDTTNNRVERFNLSGSYISQFGSSGTGNGQFKTPNGTGVDSSGNIWVVDQGNNRIQKFNSSGSWLVTVPASGCTNGSPPACTAGSGNGQFNQPSGASVDSSGNVWVDDTNNNRIQEFNSSGSFVLTFGTACGHSCSNGQFNLPNGIGVDGSGNVWVSDTGNARVQEFNGSGSFITTFGSSGSGNGQFGAASPVGIAINGGNIWVVDKANNRVQQFNSSGVYQSQFGSAGAGNGQFNLPHSIAIDSSGKLWVTDMTNTRVQEFNSSGSYLSQFGSSGTGNAQFNSSTSPKGIAVH